MKSSRIPLLALVAIVTAPLAAHASAGTELLQSQCASCHALTKPADTSLDRLLARKAPDLYYAGIKFNKEWLARWLENPTVIRPAGVMYRNVVKPSGAGTPDAIDASLIPAHPKLSASDAAAAAEALMGLGTDLGLVEKGAFKQQGSNAMAALLFNKLRGCSSCHAAKADGGPHSGPELFTAGDRLQGDFVTEYIRDPQKFDPHIWMPKLELTDGDVQKLTGYLMTLKQAGAK